MNWAQILNILCPFKAWVIFAQALLPRLSTLFWKCDTKFFQNFLTVLPIWLFRHALFWKSLKWGFSSSEWLSTTYCVFRQDLNTHALWFLTLTQRRSYSSTRLPLPYVAYVYILYIIKSSQLLYFTHVCAFPHEADNSTTVEGAGKRRWRRRREKKICYWWLWGKMLNLHRLQPNYNSYWKQLNLHKSH